MNTYLTSLKNPGSGWEHHFKPSSAAGMGAKPSPVANAGGGQVNPWKTGQYNTTNAIIGTRSTACSRAQARGSNKIVDFREINIPCP